MNIYLLLLIRLIDTIVVSNLILILILSPVNFNIFILLVIVIF